MYQLCGSITPLFNIIDLYVTSYTVGCRCTGIAIRDIYNIKDGIEYLSIKWY